MAKEVAQSVRAFAQERFGPDIQLRIHRLRGGLEAHGVSQVLVLQKGKPAGSFVAKPFSGSCARELEAYRLLRQIAKHDLAPKLLGWTYSGENGNSGWLFLEWIATQRGWPWRDLEWSALVVAQLAALHRVNAAPIFTEWAASWDYEQELQQSANDTFHTYCRAAAQGVRPGGRPMAKSLERLIAALPRLRRELMSAAGVCLLHGDVHPGNVAVKRNTALLLDWGRARIGSPLEDIASWIHSVAFWEPEVRRKHDTLLERYRSAIGSAPASLSRDFRDACILAGACNGLAGALRYHLAVVSDPARSDHEKYDSYRAAADWLRILRRADQCFTS